jgi:hypothetical protein
VADGHHLGVGTLFDDGEHVLHQAAALVGQLLGIEAEVEDEVLWQRRQAGERVAKNALHVVLRDHRGLRRLAGRHADGRAGRGQVHRAFVVRHHGAPGGGLAGVGQQHDQIRLRWLRRLRLLGDAAGRGQHEEDKGEKGTAHANQSEVTSIPSVVPRTPTMAAGVSRRTASGASLAICPET